MRTANRGSGRGCATKTRPAPRRQTASTPPAPVPAPPEIGRIAGWSENCSSDWREPRNRAKASRNVAVTPSASAAVSRTQKGWTAHSSPVSTATVPLRNARRANRKYRPAVSAHQTALEPAYCAVPRRRIDDRSNRRHQPGIAGGRMRRLFLLGGEGRAAGETLLVLEIVGQRFEIRRRCLDEQRAGVMGVVGAGHQIAGARSRRQRNDHRQEHTIRQREAPYFHHDRLLLHPSSKPLTLARVMIGDAATGEQVTAHRRGAGATSCPNPSSSVRLKCWTCRSYPSALPLIAPPAANEPRNERSAMSHRIPARNVLRILPVILIVLAAAPRVGAAGLTCSTTTIHFQDAYAGWQLLVSDGERDVTPHGSL